MPIGLYLDIAVGVRSDGFDAWCDRSPFWRVAIGAPPIVSTPQGRIGTGRPRIRSVRTATVRAIYTACCSAAMHYARRGSAGPRAWLASVLYLVPHGVAASQGDLYSSPFRRCFQRPRSPACKTACLVIGEISAKMPGKSPREPRAEGDTWSYQVDVCSSGVRRRDVRARKAHRDNSVLHISHP